MLPVVHLLQIYMKERIFQVKVRSAISPVTEIEAGIP
jgi:hypothetical protein